MSIAMVEHPTVAEPTGRLAEKYRYRLWNVGGEVIHVGAKCVACGLVVPVNELLPLLNYAKFGYTTLYGKFGYTTLRSDFERQYKLLAARRLAALGCPHAQVQLYSMTREEPTS